MHQLFNVVLCAVLILASGALPVAAAPGVPAQSKIAEAYGRLPLSFEANEGQMDKEVKYLCRGRGFTLFLTPAEAVLSLREPQREAAVVRMRLAGGSSHPRVVGQSPLATKSNYLLGNDPRQWHTDVANYARVHYESVYPGVDLVYRADQGQLEYDFVIAPGADPGRIHLDFRGADSITIGTQGELILRTASGDLVQRAPVLYQETGEQRQPIEGRYILLAAPEAERAGTGAYRLVGFEVGRYDRARPLIIDPTLVYSTFLGRGDDDAAYGIAVDGGGNAYVTGVTLSTGFPGVSSSSIQPANGGSDDVFVIKINPAGTAIVYSTFLGGSGAEEGDDIAIDGAGNVYVAGATTSTTFPGVSASSIQPVNHNGDAFVTKINPAGTAIVYSTFLGGNRFETRPDIAVDSVGNAYVTGVTDSTTFPGVTGSSIQPANNGDNEGYVTKINAAGTAIIYSTFLGGSGTEFFDGIAVDGAGNAYVTGETRSNTFPGVSGSSIQPANGNGLSDAFVTKINAAGTAIVYSTFLGGSDRDVGLDIAVDGAGNAYVSGLTDSPTFPGVDGSSIQPANSGGTDGFVTKINATGTAIIYSTFLGGAEEEFARGIAVDGASNAYVTGETLSTTFPGVSGSSIQPANSGNFDGFVAKINAAGTAIGYSTFLGGSVNEIGFDIAVDGAGNAYVTGQTDSPTFPVVTGSSIQPVNRGAIDAFVVKIGPQTSTCVSPPNTTMVAWYPFDEVTGTLSANRATGNTGVQINGPAPIPGIVAGALSFDGVDDYVESPSSIVTNIGPANLPLSCSGNYSSCRGNFSIDMWIRVDPSGSGILTILDKRSGSPPAIKGYHLFVLNGVLGLQLADARGPSGFSNYLSPILTPALVDGRWHHIAVTIRRTTHGGIRWYHNGILFGISDPTSRLGSLENNSPLRIGTRTASPPLSGWFPGDLDELEIYDRVLTPQEVVSIFNAGASGKCK